MSLPIQDGPLARALSQRGYDELTPVQAAVLEERAVGRDLLVSAQTGSGKTVAYGLSIGATLLAGAERLEAAGEPLALVVAPTRELALQVQRELEWLYAETGARVVACVGGMDPKIERRRLDGGVHIVVGTPGRLRDHIERGALDVSRLQAVVLDEADEMLDLGFREDLEFILETTPKERRTLLFSATLPKAITAIARRYQREAVRIETAGAARGHADIDYRAIRIVPNEIEHAVVNTLRFFEAESAIVFCSTRETVRRLHAGLFERGFSAVTLSGELSQSERNHALQALRDGRARVCVATDVAARGIDLPSLGLVIHADLPHDAEILQHRSGRTGRAGRKGVSVLLVPTSRRRKAETMMVDAGVVPVWSGPPAADEIRALDEQRLLADPLLAEAPTDEDLATARTLLATRSAEDLAAALARLYRARLPAPEDVFDPGEARSARDRGPRNDKAAETPSQGGPLGPTVWFRLSAGRRDNADPKWLLPLICRRGQITRQEIGAIRIFDGETKFEVAETVVKRFMTALKSTEGADVAIEKLAEPFDARAKAERPARPHRPRDADARDVKPARPTKSGWAPKPWGDAKPPRDKTARAATTPYEARPPHGAAERPSVPAKPKPIRPRRTRI